ncbi:MAG: NAD-dependent epimerase/dehydratase family protein [Actinobacteria bacterium]|nr:MAG: NAD-dependent epimerase/dehydratase family protein [Actinomycetota bacterium]
MRGGPTGSTILVTGGTGSFGSTVARQLLSEDRVSELRILSRDEAKQDDLRRHLADSRARFYVGDVRDYQSVSEATRGVDYVFHAAALKQVPSCEFFPQQAVATNVHGTDNVIRAADAHGVKSVVCLSTDKAVYPINAMGISKAMMEKVAQAYARNNPGSGTVVSVTRYGNVMYSRGSVIPLFVEQIRQGKPLTVTDPGMTRFLMSLAESVELVQYAFEKASPGDIFVRKAPASTIEDLAKAVARLLGVEPQIRVIGSRHGEKRYESLLSVEEMGKAEDMGGYFRVPLDGRSLDYTLYTEEGEQGLDRGTDYNSDNTEQLDVDQVMDVVAALPEMQQVMAEARR